MNSWYSILVLAQHNTNNVRLFHSLFQAGVLFLELGNESLSLVFGFLLCKSYH